MDDVQSRPDDRRIPIDQVGVSDLRYPIRVLDKQQGTQVVIAKLALSVSLPHHFKGTHMSRFIELLSRYQGEVTMQTLPRMLHELRTRLDAESARIEIGFPYFLERAAPVTESKALMDYECTFVGESDGVTDQFILGVRVPVTSLCPCSKEISDYGAHNQRGYITIEVRGDQTEGGEAEILWIEDLIEVAERSASAPVYPLVKRADERYITMQAYDNPAFVEDMVRSVAVHLQRDARVRWFRVHARNDESIHNHSVFARVEWSRDGVGQ